MNSRERKYWQTDQVGGSEPDVVPVSKLPEALRLALDTSRAPFDARRQKQDQENIRREGPAVISSREVPNHDLPDYEAGDLRGISYRGLQAPIAEEDDASPRVVRATSPARTSYGRDLESGDDVRGRGYTYSKRPVEPQNHRFDASGATES